MSNIAKFPERRTYICCENCDGVRWYCTLSGTVCCACYQPETPYVACPNCTSDRWFIDDKNEAECVYCGLKMELVPRGV